MIKSDWTYLGLFFIALFSLVLIAEIFRKLFHWQPEASRKFVHVFTGILVSLTPFALQSMWPMLILGTLFTILDFVAIRKNLFRGMHGTKRHSYGTVFYPLSFVILVVLLWDNDKLILVTAMLIMAIADALASLVGERVKHPIHLEFGFEAKSVQGSLTMLVSTFMIVALCSLALPQFTPIQLTALQVIWYAVLVAIIATACEVISLHGSDNLTVPLGAAFTMHYLFHHTPGDALFFTLGIILSLLAAIMSFRFKFLDTGGAIGAFLLGVVVFGIGRLAFTIPILTFFITSSVISNIGKGHKQKLITIFEKTGKRDLWQVLANGGLAGALVLTWNYYHLDIFYIFFLGALAAVTADTWATEIGVLSRTKPVSILNFKTVPPGTSGGITLIGTAGAAAGSLLLVITGWLTAPPSSVRIIDNKEFVIIMLAGLLASFVDSFLGATVQAKYRCQVCNKITEKTRHCQQPAVHIGGYIWINNDMVNLFCAVSSILFLLVIRSIVL
ncbi:MAG TPA: DUF92 domain-containing protein [bacterium]|nr:DUF92 domain-containing protein [bacterium]HPN45763.1 DUF92 domain-containing protein [bacterium]